MSEREGIQRQIFALRNCIDAEIAYGDAEKANRLLDQIGNLERELGEVDKRGPEARPEIGQ